MGYGIVCTYCGSGELVKRGKRINKVKEVQLYYCRECHRRFSEGTSKNKTYDISTIVKTLSLYNSGLTTDAVSEKTSVPRSTISNWNSEYRDLFNMIRSSKEIQAFRKERRIIERYKYIHNLVYLYQQNSFKIENNIRTREKGLYDYLQRIKKGEIDSRLFTSTDTRASAIKLNIGHSLPITKTYNNACKFAGIAVNLVTDNKDRHSAVEKIMLENDTSTIATEVPVFLQLSKSTIPWLKNMVSANDHITGHIDILQYRNGRLYILDYKPGADKEKPLGQLFIYACCLSKITAIPFSKIRLAWFDENVYYETGAMDVYKELMKNFKPLPVSGKIKATNPGFKKAPDLGHGTSHEFGKSKQNKSFKQ